MLYPLSYEGGIRAHVRSSEQSDLFGAMHARVWREPTHRLPDPSEPRVQRDPATYSEKPNKCDVAAAQSRKTTQHPAPARNP